MPILEDLSNRCNASKVFAAMPEPQNKSEIPRPQNPADENPVSFDAPEFVGDDKRSVFPYYLFCIPVALGLTWGFVELLERNLFYFTPGKRGQYGTVFINLTSFHAPILLLAMLFFSYWGCRFALEGDATPGEMLRRGLLYTVGVFALGLFIEWLIIIW